MMGKFSFHYSNKFANSVKFNFFNRRQYEKSNARNQERLSIFNDLYIYHSHTLKCCLTVPVALKGTHSNPAQCIRAVRQ